MISRVVVPLLALLALAPSAPAWAEAGKWAPAIEAFEQQDAENPPEKGGILFVGSSSIRFWNTDEAFPKLDVINRGFGGSQTADVLAYADRIVLPYKPRIIVLYAGDNDIAAGKTPQEVFDDTKELFGIIHENLPETRIVYIAIKPSLFRWGLVDKMRAANALIRDHAAGDDRIDFLDVDAPMLGEDGKPREELFIKDGLHLSDEGYALWNKLVRPYLHDATEN